MTTAREKIMNYLARRDHSELELRRKLETRFTPEETDEAIQFARQNKLMRNPEELSQDTAEMLTRKGKGAEYIRAYLASRGLPEVIINTDDERQKALDLVELKLRLEPPFSYEDQTKIARLLSNRGFDDDTIEKVIHEKS